MTVNLFCLTKEFAIVVADRRLTYTNGKVASDRATKVLNIVCKDACLIAAFNGYAGNDEDSAPLNWLERDQSLVTLPLEGLIDRVKATLEDQLKGVERKVARLSLTMVGYNAGIPFMCHISNYEQLGGGGTISAVASETMHVEKLVSDFVFAQTGYYPPIKAGRLKRKFKKLLERGANLKTLKKELLKAARDVPFSDKTIKVVGANCHCVVLRPNGSFEGGPETLGRSTLLEIPSFMGRGFTYST